MRATRRDSSHAAIRTALRSAGALVVDLGGAGVTGLPDLMILYPRRGGHIYLMECKAPLGPKGGSSGRRLRKGQAAFAAQWPVLVAHGPAEACVVLQAAHRRNTGAPTVPDPARDCPPCPECGR